MWQSLLEKLQTPNGIFTWCFKDDDYAVDEGKAIYLLIAIRLNTIKSGRKYKK